MYEHFKKYIFKNLSKFVEMSTSNNDISVLS